MAKTPAPQAASPTAALPGQLSDLEIAMAEAAAAENYEEAARLRNTIQIA